MATAHAGEWGRRQAEAAPVWTEAKWRRAGAILGVELNRPDPEDVPDARPGEPYEHAAAA